MSERHGIDPHCNHSFNVKTVIDDLCYQISVSGGLICRPVCLCSLPAGSRRDTLVPLLPVRRHSGHSADQEQTVPSPHEQRAARLHLHSPAAEVRNTSSQTQSKGCFIYCLDKEKALPAYLWRQPKAFMPHK